MSDRKLRKEMMREHHAYIRTLPEELTLVPRHEFPPFEIDPTPVRVWRSRHYMVQEYEEQNADYPGLIRLSIHRVQRTLEGWQDGITWDELQALKRAVGYGDWYGVEVYPQDAELINVANIRHLWLLPKPLNIGWFEGEHG